ncbi:MAG: DUF1461 domain-containing protein [Candidatus Competibacterales bacterium]|nr:DUF1461 domain-containing protein [Candidatus Competibacterales bacterium]
MYLAGQRLLRVGYLLLMLPASLWLAWVLLARAEFLFPLWYDTLDIDRHIATYAPQNRIRPHFQLTTRTERERLFVALNAAVHDGGRGLAGLRYHAPGGRPLGTFLTIPERRHLEDVAGLIETVRWPGWIATGLWLIVSVALVRLRLGLPAWRRTLGGVLASAAVAGLVVYLMGPERVFYRLHEWVFPADRPWFFYYQESLLTTLLEAPDLFGAIAVAWAALALLLLGLSYALVVHCGPDRRTPDATSGRPGSNRSAAPPHTRPPGRRGTSARSGTPG